MTRSMLGVSSFLLGLFNVFGVRTCYSSPKSWDSSCVFPNDVVILSCYFLPLVYTFARSFPLVEYIYLHVYLSRFMKMIMGMELMKFSSFAADKFFWVRSTYLRWGPCYISTKSCPKKKASSRVFSSHIVILSFYFLALVYILQALCLPVEYLYFI